MSFIDNIKNDIEEASARYDLMNDKIMLFESVAYNDYIIKQKEAYLDAYKYGGDVEDYFTESESESFADKTKAVIQKIVEALKEFLQKCKEKIMEIMQKVRESNLVKKLEELFKINPKAASIKVEIEDDTKKINLLNKLLDEHNKHKAKIKSGKIDKSDIDEIDKRNNKMAIIVSSAAAVITISLGAALLLLKKNSEEANRSTTNEIDQKQYIAMANAINEEYLKKVNFSTNYDNLLNGNGYQKKVPVEIHIKSHGESRTIHDEIEMGHVITGLAEEESKLKQFIAKFHINKLTNLVGGIRTCMSTISSAVAETANKVKGNDQVPAPKVESASYEDSFDADDYFSELCNDIFGEDTSTKDDFDKMYSELCNDIFF